MKFKIAVGISVVLLVALALMPKGFWLSEEIEEKELAVLRKIDGTAEIRKGGAVGFEAAKEGAPVRNSSTLRLAAGSSAEIDFPLGTRIKLLSDSQVVFESIVNSTGKYTQLTFLTGKYELLKSGKPENLVATINDRSEDIAVHRTLNNAMKVEVTSSSTLPTTPSTSTSLLAPPTTSIGANAKSEISTTTTVREHENSLPDDYIDSVIRNQKGQFNKCYSTHLQTHPQSKGKMDISFTITADGNLAGVRLLGSTMNDKKIDDCVLEVFRRVRFKSFAADPIIVNYPLQFE